MHAPVSGRAHGSAALLIQQNHLLGRRLRVVCISHCTSDFVPPCTHIQMRVYSTAFPVFPTCCIFPSFSNAERYRVAVASETCRSFSTSSLVILPFTVSTSRIFSSFLCFRS